MKGKRRLQVLNVVMALAILAAMLVPAAVAAPPKPTVNGGADLQAKLAGVIDAVGYRLGEVSVYKEGDTEVPGEILVRLKNRQDGAAVQAWADRHGARVMSSIDPLNVYQLKVDNPAAAARVRGALQADPNVAYATPNRIMRITEDSQAPVAATHPNDPLHMQQYALTNERAFDAWDLSRGAPQAIVMVIDTGIDYNHPDITGKYVFGYDFVNDDSDAMDDNNHGTHVAGKAAAWSNNGVGIAGLSWYSILMAAKVCNASGSCTYLNVAKGVFLAGLLQLILAGQGFHVIANMSLGGSGDDPTLRTVVDWAYSQAGILMIASAGNSGGYGANYPAAYPGVVSVACTNQSDARCSFSTYHETVEAAAPGYQILSTIRNSAYGYMSGTSMSAPDVTGIAALVWAKWPSKTNAQVRNCLNVGVDDKGTPGRDQYYGYGRINALKAVQCVGTVPTPTPTTPPVGGVWRVILTWGATPTDMDNHLWLPSSNPYHVYYGQMGTCNSTPYAFLDTDDQNGYGPETITVCRGYNGSYRSAVRAWANSIAGTGANVKIYQGSTLKANVTVPSSGSGVFWYVADFNPVTGAVTVVNQVRGTSPAPYAVAADKTATKAKAR